MSGIFRYQKVSTFDQTNRALPKAPKNARDVRTQTLCKRHQYIPRYRNPEKRQNLGKNSRRRFFICFCARPHFYRKSQSAAKNKRYFFHQIPYLQSSPIWIYTSIEAHSRMFVIGGSFLARQKLIAIFCKFNYLNSQYQYINDIYILIQF